MTSELRDLFKKYDDHVMSDQIYFRFPILYYYILQRFQYKLNNFKNRPNCVCIKTSNLSNNLFKIHNIATYRRQSYIYTQISQAQLLYMSEIFSLLFYCVVYEGPPKNVSCLKMSHVKNITVKNIPHVPINCIPISIILISHNPIYTILLDQTFHCILNYIFMSHYCSYLI